MVLKVNTNLVQSIFLETMLQTMHMCMHIYFRYFNIFLVLNYHRLLCFSCYRVYANFGRICTFRKNIVKH